MQYNGELQFKLSITSKFISGSILLLIGVNVLSTHEFISL